MNRPWYREPWPWILMAPPAAAVIAGAATVWIAVGSADGLVADDYYKRGLAINQVLALNNGAWALHQLKDARAAEIGKRAWEAAPKSAAVLDTYGVILSDAGDPKAVGLLREAVSAAPKNAQIRLHLAQALARAGDRAAAKTEVAAVLKAAPSGPVGDAARALEAKL